VTNEAGGKIIVSGSGAEGIYVSNGGLVRNDGVIEIDSGGAAGICLGQGGLLQNNGTIIVRNGGVDIVNTSSGSSSVGRIKIDDDGPMITVGDVVYDAPTLINGGYINFEDKALDFGAVRIASTEGNIGTISARDFSAGKFIVLPNATQGNNLPIRIVQYLKGVRNMPNNGSITAVSHSVSWIADLRADPKDPDAYRIILVKIPYAELAAGTNALEFGKGLDAIYEPARGKELRMFDALDLISDKSELAATFDMELRGNYYADLQRRALHVGEVFESAYDRLRGRELYVKERTKIGAIVSGGNARDKNPGVEHYDSRSEGFLVIREKDAGKPGSVRDLSLGFARTRFDYKTGSRDTAWSLDLGAGYGKDLGRSGRLRWESRAELIGTYHESERKIHLSNGIWTNSADHYSGLLLWRNKLRYGFPEMNGGAIRAGLSLGLDLGYGKLQGFREKGDGIRLEIREKEIRVARPWTGLDFTVSKATAKGKWILSGDVRVARETGSVYDGPNEARIRGTDADYYDLEQPEEPRWDVGFGLRLARETRRGSSIGVFAARHTGDRDTTTYGVDFLFRFQ